MATPNRRNALAGVSALLVVAVVAIVGWSVARDDRAGRPVTSPPSSPATTAAPAPSPRPSGTRGGGGPLADLSIGTRDASVQAGGGAVDAPVTVRIPSLGVTAPVDPVGVQDDGSMTIPTDGDRLGWYRYGPTPGGPQGSAVVAGHVDTRAGGPGALFRLRDLEPGDEVVVTTGSGREVTYRVSGREVFQKTALPTDDLFRRDGAPVLTIITCGGPFQPELRSYRDNVVVVADPVAGG
ncbi:class F sortase [Thalassiella azotivora]